MKLETPGVSELASIATEKRNTASSDIDLMSTTEILQLINTEDSKVTQAVQHVLPKITEVVNLCICSLNKGARVIYMGAGTSGRLGILDAVECRPTFSVPDNVFVGLLAGGERAMIHAVEGAEDNEALAQSDLTAIQLNADDLVIGLAASGRTPYVISGLKYAKEKGCNTACIICSPNGPVLDFADVGIVAEVGPEVLTGSTRMKSGTAQKLILNMISTTTMIKMGKTFGNLMVDVNATNEKLVARAQSIVMQATNCSLDVAKQTLNEVGNNAKLAILMILTGQDVKSCEALLLKEKGFIRKALSSDSV